ncbi:amidohydrolase [Viridibacillus arvi]|uniref:N-acyl-L-amino acid amidohydrolase n=1 Tax=Viridibacillus arvi TaxID=263475 RepID=A0A0M0LL79_9BACL|nr:amidohydrolase [Viridibacillus arvi]KOO51756.1 N-acyl-L-amino acid amidohydrolase [Viridibacillus arvi]
MSKIQEQSAEIQQVMNDVISWRQHLHENPELSFNEYETSAFIYKTLSTFPNLELSKPTKTSIVARLVGNEPGKVLAFRADIDALPIQEEVDLPFASKVPDVMHACGHDAHTAILLGAAKILSKQQHKIKGEIRFIFQHAEEVFPGGASEMVAANVMDGVDEILGLHVFSMIPTGKIGFCPGYFTANSDTFEIDVIGKGGHSSQPEDSINPILIGSQIVSSLHQIIPQKIAAKEQAVLAVTEFNGGAAKNIIPERIVIGGGIRTYSQSVREEIARQIEVNVKNIVASHEADYNLEFTYGYDSVYNDEQIIATIEEVVKKEMGANYLLHVSPIMGGEDFSAFLSKAPGVFLGIGAGFEDETLNYPHHHPKFQINEDALEIGVNVFVHTAKKFNM